MNKKPREKRNKPMTVKIFNINIDGEEAQIQAVGVYQVLKMSKICPKAMIICSYRTSSSQQEMEQNQRQFLNMRCFLL